jgi:hypothetical protein
MLFVSVITKTKQKCFYQRMTLKESVCFAESKVWIPPSDISEAIFLWQHTPSAYTLLDSLSALVLTDIYEKPFLKYHQKDGEPITREESAKIEGWEEELDRIAKTEGLEQERIGREEADQVERLKQERIAREEAAKAE